MRRLIILFFLVAGIPVLAQTISEYDAVLAFYGAGSYENLNSYDVEHLQDLYSRPLEINLSNQSSLISSGLFTPYQAASLSTYIRNRGEVLSFSELAAVDGFGRDFVDKVAPFISLKSFDMPGKAKSERESFQSDLAVRGGLKRQNDVSGHWNSGLKYRLKAGQRASAAISVSRSYDGERYLSGHLAWHLKRIDAKIVAGDFNARFGQGLTLWNGMSMSGVSSPTSLVRRPGGISQTWSFTGSSAFTGLAASLSHHGFTVTAMLAGEGMARIREFPDKSSLLPALNLSWLKGCMQVSMTNYAEFTGVSTEDPRIPDMKSAFDLRCCVKGTDLFGEVSWDWVNSVPAALIGTTFLSGDPLKLAVNMRYYPFEYNALRSAAVRSGTRCSNEYGASLAGDFRFGDHIRMNGQEGFGSSCQRYIGAFAVDAAYYPDHQSKHSSQIKIVNNWDIMLSPSFQMAFKVTERIRAALVRPARTDVRTDLKYISRSVSAAARLNVVADRYFGFLTYIEGGYRQESLSLYMRIGLFLIDNWDDRIYVYERDAPGSFNVPAFYGRGVWSALTASWRFSRHGRLYVRGAFTTYPFMSEEKKKPGKAELKLQTVFSF